MIGLAAFFADLIKLPFELYALCGDTHIHRTGERHNRAENGQIAALCVNIADHGLIQLQLIDGQHFEIMEIAKTSAKIIERQRHPRFAQLGQSFARALQIGKRDMLGYL